MKIARCLAVLALLAAAAPSLGGILPGNIHPLAEPGSDRGAVPPNLGVNNVYLLLRHSEAQEQALQRVLQRQQDPHSPQFHQWLTPEQFGSSFGPTDASLAMIGQWIRQHGLRIDAVARGRGYVRISGPASAMEAAFQIRFHYFEQAGELHRANVDEPRLPTELESVVGGIRGLNDFRPHPLHQLHGAVVRDSSGWQRPQYSDGGSPPTYDVGPTDFATIYNALPLRKANIDGTGIAIALPEQSDIRLQDVRAYRTIFGLPAMDPQVVVPPGTANPGQTGDANEDEALLDTEIAGAVAPGASLIVVPQADVNDAISYIVDNKLAPILSVSYGECELQLGTAGNQFFGGGGGTTGVFEQAAAEGISVLVSAGDAGSADCDNSAISPNEASGGLAVNGFASTPYSTAVGGTDFDDFGTYSTYWSSSNASGTLTSALSYVPEMSWNDSCASSVILQVYGPTYSASSAEALCNNSAAASKFLDLLAGAGGQSACTTPGSSAASSCAGGYARPAWQSGVAGIPTGSNRLLPDVSLFAANGQFGHSYIICDSTATPNSPQCNSSSPKPTFTEIGGTSASTPALAGIVAMLVQSEAAQTPSASDAGWQGLLNPALYTLAASQFGSESTPNAPALSNCNSSQGNAVAVDCVFYDVTVGDITVPCSKGSLNCNIGVSSDKYGVLGAAAQPTYVAGTGFDLATGLGSVNAANLVNGWGSAAELPATTTTLSSSANSVPLGASVTLSAAVKPSSGSGIPAGSVTFKDGTTPLSTQTLSAGTASYATSSLAQGAHSITASYSGGGGFAPSISSAVTVTVTGPTISLSPATLAFGDQTVGTSSAASTIVLSNPSSAPLTIKSVSITGDFSENTTCTTTVAAGASCKIAVSFSPQAEAARSGTLTVLSNADSSPSIVTLSGAGDEPQANLSPTNLNFSHQLVGTTSSPQSVTLSNSGDGPLDLSGVTVSGSAAFAQTNACPKQLAPTASCVISVTYSPSSAGSDAGSLTVASDSFKAVMPVALNGSAVVAPAVLLAPATLAFSAQNLGTTSAAQVITLGNNGKGQLAIYAVSATGDFKVASACGSSIAPGASCNINVSFAPTADGVRSGALTVITNAESSPDTVPLSGTGAGVAPAPVVSISPDPLSFAAQQVGISSTQTLTLQNTGNAALNIGGITASGDFSQTNSCPVTVAIGASCSISVTFDPVASGLRSGVLTVTSDALSNPDTVALSGMGLASSSSSSSSGGGSGSSSSGSSSGDGSSSSGGSGGSSGGGASSEKPGGGAFSPVAMVSLFAFAMLATRRRRLIGHTGHSVDARSNA